MTYESLIKLEKEELVNLIHSMGHVIRSLDDDNIHAEYWTNDEDEMSEKDRELAFKMGLMTDKFYGDNSY